MEVVGQNGDDETEKNKIWHFKKTRRGKKGSLALKHRDWERRREMKIFFKPVFYFSVELFTKPARLSMPTFSSVSMPVFLYSEQVLFSMSVLSFLHVLSL